ncbi:MAG: hypothetical protein ACR2HO_09800 [Rubrobacteraceae bacterium]
MELLQRVSSGIERGVRTVLENPSLLIGLMVFSLLLKRFAAPTARGRAGSLRPEKTGRKRTLNELQEKVVRGTVLSRQVLASGLLLAALMVVTVRSSEEA